jgi:hypothetical protein
MLRTLMWGLVVLVPLPTARALDSPKAPAKGAGDATALKVEDKLTRDDPKDRVLKNSHHKVHTFKMKAGVTYVIDLVSRDFDAFLRLEDSAGKQLAQDDDSGGGLNARIVFKAEHPDSYRIIATTFVAGGTGKYTLTVKEASGATLAWHLLQQEYQKANVELNQQFMKAKTEKEQEKIRDEFFERAAQFLGRSSKFAQDHRDDPTARQAEGMVRNTLGMLGNSSSPVVEKQLRLLLGKTSQKDLQGQIRLALAKNLSGQYDRAYQKKDKRAAKLAAEAETLLKEVVTKDAGIAGLVQQAKDALFQLQKLSVGKTAPEIEGEDLDGKKFKLSDYRGKVLVLDFWGNW